MTLLLPHRISLRPFKVHTISAPCGSGKTEVCLDIVEANIPTKNILLVLPTIPLIEEVEKRLTERGVRFKCLHNENCSNVGAAISDYVKRAPDVGRVLIITLKAYLSMRWFEGEDNWQIIIDEVPQADQLHKYKLPRNSEALLKHVTITTTQFPGVLRVVPRNKGKRPLTTTAVVDCGVSREG